MLSRASRRMATELQEKPFGKRALAAARTRQLALALRHSESKQQMLSARLRELKLHMQTIKQRQRNHGNAENDSDENDHDDCESVSASLFTSLCVDLSHDLLSKQIGYVDLTDKLCKEQRNAVCLQIDRIKAAIDAELERIAEQDEFRDACETLEQAAECDLEKSAQSLTSGKLLQLEDELKLLKVRITEISQKITQTRLRRAAINRRQQAAQLSAQRNAEELKAVSFVRGRFIVLLTHANFEKPKEEIFRVF